MLSKNLVQNVFKNMLMAHVQHDKTLVTKKISIRAEMSNSIKNKIDAIYFGSLRIVKISSLKEKLSELYLSPYLFAFLFM